LAHSSQEKKARSMGHKILTDSRVDR
jgi:hypothetical protein